MTGKSTLLKLLANNISPIVQPIFIDEITLEKAQLLKKDIDAEGLKVAAFIDNAADTIPLFLVAKSGALSVYTGDIPLSLAVGDKVIYIETGGGGI